MITKNDIIKMARHVLRRSQGRPDNRIIHPLRDWLIGLSIAVLMLVTLSIYAGSLFFTEKNNDIDAYSVDIETVTYEYERVNNVLETYRARETTFDKLRSFAPESSLNSLGEDEEDDESEEIPLSSEF